MIASGVLDSYKGLRCLVTGHTGFKGAWLSLWLHSLGADVWGLALNPPTAPSLFADGKASECVHDVRGDIRDVSAVERAVRDSAPALVFHLAAQPLVRLSYTQPRETFDTNVMGAVNLLQALRSAPSVRAIVVVTSDKCYENREWPYPYRENDALGGHDPYSASKAAAEHVASAFYRSYFAPAGVPLATVRAGNVIAGGDWAEDRIIPDAVRAIAAGEDLVIRNPHAVRPWQHVLDPLYGYLALGAALLDAPSGHRFAGPWNFGPLADSAVGVSRLVELFHRSYGQGRCRTEAAANPLHEATHLALSSDKAHHALGWKPYWPLDDAVHLTAEWYRRYRGGDAARELCIEQVARHMAKVRAHE